MNEKMKGQRTVGQYSSIEGLENIDKVVGIDQSPIGRTPRSNPITYTGAFDYIRDLYAQTNEAKARGYKKGRFSFNVRGGRCEKCQGEGQIKIEMQFLPDMYVTCEACKGTRYNKDTLQIDYKGKNIAEVLDMTVDQALEFFKNHPPIKRKLDLLQEVGLGYIRLGQYATTLSGGESQRIKLAKELSKSLRGHTVYILDEPTTGLHFHDVDKLLKVLKRLVAQENTVIVIEHNMDIIRFADWIIDLGPEGGAKGGQIIAEGTVEDLCKTKSSYTGKFLKEYLDSIKK
jgi:excinuclease ABC subunit A